MKGQLYTQPPDAPSDYLVSRGAQSAGALTKIKLEKLGGDYNPREDSVLKALVRLMAAAASDGVAESDADANVA